MNRRSWAKFDVAGALPAGATWDLVQKATLKVWLNAVTAAGTINVMGATAAFAESTLTHNTAPGTRGVDVANTPYATKPVSVASEFVTFDVTELVRDWLDGTVPNYGLVLGAGDTTVNVTLPAKEFLSTVNNRAMTLDVTVATRRINPAGDVSMGQFTVGPRP